MSELSKRYDYERLMEKPFQQLCNALLAQSYPDIQCFPVGHRDGGRDAVLRQPDKQSVIFQVKWTSKPSKDPVVWLTQTIKEERDNIQRLVSEGAAEYFLLTSVAGTAVPKSGSMDRMDVELGKYSREFGIPMKVWWRADIDARVDASPDSLKWAYSDMLAGHDLVRYLIEGANAAAQDHELRTLVRKVIATQWEEDAKVKFKQAELTSHNLTDLFIDVEAVRSAQALSTRGLQMAELRQENLGGAAQYLLSAKQPFTLVKGEPGQGKSTLGQYLCQVHRAAFLKDRAREMAGLPPVDAPRVPLRVDLRDYAAWIDGDDPLEEHLGTSRKAGRRRKASLEDFLAYLLRARSGGLHANVATIDSITQRLPMLIVLDGLDEVARADTRAQVVKHIDEFTARLQHSLLAPRVIVTTRPNAAALAEPSPRMYETIALSHLRPGLRTAYLRKWAAARSVTGRDRRELQRVFDQRSAEPHIAQLADNPMQLTILLYLLHKRGNSVPKGRTELYTSYMETFLDREAEKSPQVEEHRRDLEEVTAYLGWLLQAEAEGSGGSGRIGLKDLERSILTYLFDADKNIQLVAALFTAVTDRVWALTSKIQGTFEFDVQPLREYFAARYLYEYAGAERRDFDTSRVLQHLVRRPYWMNVARFYAGFARNNELEGLVDALEEEKESRRQPLEVLTAAWTLLSDGVFSKRSRSQQRAAGLFLDDLSVCLLGFQIRYGLDLPTLPLHHGGRELAAELLAAVDRSPGSATAQDRVRVASELLRGSGEFEDWWIGRLQASAGSADERVWLALGAAVGAGQDVQSADVPLQLSLSDMGSTADAIRAGLTPPQGSVLEEQMVSVVLGGHCFEVSPVGKGLPADLLRVLAPQEFLNRIASPDGHMFRLPGIHSSTRVSSSQRQAAWRRLVQRDPRFRALQEAVKVGTGERRTTSLWSNTAQAINAIFGPCWAAAATAVIGAAAPNDAFVTGGDMISGSQPLGPAPDYGRLLQEIRRYRLDASWWTEQYERHTDALSRATWALALTSAAAPSVVTSLVGRLNEAVTALPEDSLHALLTSSSRMGLSKAVGRPLPFERLNLGEGLSAPTALLLSYHNTSETAGLVHLADEDLAAMSRYGQAAWPANEVLTWRMLSSPSASVLEALRAHSPHGPAHLPLRKLPTDPAAAGLFQQIIDHPADYPRGWVWAAQETLAGGLAGPVHPYLSDVAAREEWFSSD